MANLRADEVRTAVAARIAAEVDDLVECSEPYFLARSGKSLVHKSFTVGLGKSASVDPRQRVVEGARTATTIKVLVVYQAEHANHLDVETQIGLLRDAVCKALVGDWSADIAMVWSEDPEVTTKDALVLFESWFTAIHHKPLE